MRIKSMIITLIAVLMSTLLPAFSFADTAIPKPMDSFYVNDFANVIAEKNENYMVNYGIRLHEQTGTQVVLVTVDSTNGMSMEEYASSLFKTWKVGSADQGNGVLLLLSIKDQRYSAVLGKGVETTDTKLSQLLSQSLEPDMSRKDYSSGARNAYGAIIQSLGGTWKESVGSRTYVADNAGILKPVTKNYLNQAGNRFAKTTGGGVYVVTVKNSGNLNLQEYTYAKFASIGAGSKDVMMVLDIEGDNYHVLQGKDVDKVLTNEWIGGILDTVLEPLFVQRNYAGGAVATASAFYSFMLARADVVRPAADFAPDSIAAPAQSAVSSGDEPVTNTAGIARTLQNKTAAVNDGSGSPLQMVIIALLLLGLLLWTGVAALQRNRNQSTAHSAVSQDPYNQRNINRRRSGSWLQQPGFAYGSRWYQRRHRQHRHYREPGPESSSVSNSRETHQRGGSSSNEEGNGRYS